MSTLSFGLKPSTSTSKQTPIAKTNPYPPSHTKKRKLAFDQDETGADSNSNLDKDEDDEDAFNALSSKSSQPRKPRDPSTANPQLSRTGTNASTSTTTSLSALRSARLHDKQASELDATVYDYDGVYDALAAQKAALAAQKSGNNSDGAVQVPKYMTQLLGSAETRKRDQMRARERAVQREREAEGEEFADKERFVTGGYKLVQEEVRRAEEEERRRAEVEEERKRREGGGMVGFHREVLRREEERERALRTATEAAGMQGAGEFRKQEVSEEETDGRVADEVNARGGKVVVNDEGEIVDKRQLLTAGLNVAPSKPSSSVKRDKPGVSAATKHDYARDRRDQDAHLSQRERQSRMMERQIEEINRKAEEVAQKEMRELEEKSKSKVTEEVKMGARERYLARKKAQEEEKREKETNKEQEIEIT